MSTPLDAETAELVRAALDEDIGSGDVTTAATVSEQASARALITQKAPGVIYGLRVAEAAFALLDADARFERMVARGAVARGRRPGAVGRSSSARVAQR